MALDTVEINQETGFPIVPDNYILRVINESNRYLTIQLVRVDTHTYYRAKWLIFGKEAYTTTTDVRVKEDYVDTYQLVRPRRTKEAISGLVQDTARKMYSDWSNSRTQRELLEDISGDYPPKKLAV